MLKVWTQPKTDRKMVYFLTGVVYQLCSVSVFLFFILLHMQMLMYSYNSGFPLRGLGEIPLYHSIIWLTPPNKLACLPHYFVQKYCFWNFHAVFGDFGLSGPPHQGNLCPKPCNLKICELLFDQWLNWISTSISYSFFFINMVCIMF